MALVVEDGTGRDDAESYISLAAFKTYCDRHGHSYGGKSDPEIEQALRRATQWLDARYAARFCGYRISEDQALALPQSGLIDRGGYALRHDAIPTRVQQATAEAAVRELASPRSLQPDVTPGKVVKGARVEGAVDVEYAIGSEVVRGQLPTLPVVDGILAPLFPRPRSPYSGRAERA